MITNIDTKEKVVDSLHEIYDAVRSHNLDIAVISLYEIIKQCLQWVDDADCDFELLVKFYVIYSKLVHLKLSSMFPSDDVEEAEQDINSLIQDIFDYKKSQQLSQALLASYAPDGRYFIDKQKTVVHAYLKEASRPALLVDVTPTSSDKNLQRLVQTFSKFLQINQRLALAPKIQRFSLKIMRERILHRIQRAANTLHDMVDTHEQSYHVVAALLTVLVLCSERCIGITQNAPFDNIVLRKLSVR